MDKNKALEKILNSKIINLNGNSSVRTFEGEIFTITKKEFEELLKHFNIKDENYNILIIGNQIFKTR